MSRKNGEFVSTSVCHSSVIHIEVEIKGEGERDRKRWRERDRLKGSKKL